MNNTYFPLGELIEDRVELSKKYNLFENKDGIHRLTDKCRKHYDEMSYLKYLKGMVEKPTRISEVKETKQKQKPVVKKQEKTIKNDPNEFKSPECQQIINEILSL
jgi:hypothetical protein